MKKQILLSLTLLSGIAFSQTDPLLAGYSADTTCSGETGEKLFYEIEVYDPDNDSTFLQISGFDAGLFSAVTATSPAWDPASDTRVFTIYADVLPGLPLGAVATTVDIKIVGGPGDAGTVVETLIDGGASGIETINTTGMDAATYCDTDNPVDITGLFTPLGGEFYWAKDDGYMFDPQAFYASGDTDVEYHWYNGSGCRTRRCFNVNFTI